MRRKRFTKFFTVGLILTTTAVLLTACGGKDKKEGAVDKDGKVTLRVFDKNSKSNKWDDRIAKVVSEKTGVNVEIISPTGDPASKLALMLSGKDYPDIVLTDRTGNLTNKYIESGAFIPLNDLIDEKGPNIKEMYGETLNKTRYQDGKNYYLSNWYGPSTEPVDAFNMRYDMVVDLLGKERADSSEPFTQDEYVDLLAKFKEKYPEVDGNKSEGIILNGKEGANFGTFESMFGVKKYYENNGQLEWKVRDPQYKKAMTFVNELYRDGYIDKEWVTVNPELLNQKLATGNILSAPNAYWNVGTANDSLKATKGEESQYVAYKVLGDGVTNEQATYGSRSSLGWDAIGITDNCENVDAAIKFIDFLASQEGQDLLLWGIEGEDYTIEDGKYVANQEVVDSFKTDFQAGIKETGIRKWTWFVNNKDHSDGSPNSITTLVGQDLIGTKFVNKNLGGDTWDTAEFEDLLPNGSTPEGLAAQKIDDIYKQSLPKMINASSEQEMNKAYDQMIKEMEAAGLKNLEKNINETHKAQMELWK